MDQFVITIARGFGSGGRTMGERLAKDLHVNYYDKELSRIASEESGIHEGLFGIADEKVKKTFFKKKNDLTSEENLFQFQSEAIKNLAEKESCIIVGRCADYVLRGNRNVIRVFIYADEEACVKEVVERFGLSQRDAEKKIEAIDRERSTYYKHHTGNDWDCARNYDLCLNSGELGFDKCIEIIKAYMEVKSKK